MMEIVNLSRQTLAGIYGWIPYGLHAKKIIFLPDAYPSESPLPNGTVVLTQQKDWRQFAISDCGCGMRLLKSDLYIKDINMLLWEDLANNLRKKKGRIGDLGGGNHFLDVLKPLPDGNLYFLIHTGPTNGSKHISRFVNNQTRFDLEFERLSQWSLENREEIHKTIESFFGPLHYVLDLPHNTYERLPNDGVIIRKGAVHIKPGEISILPSHMMGDAVLIQATEKIDQLLYSMSHGTGRKVPRAEAENLFKGFNFASLREQVLIPRGVSDESLQAVNPAVYHDLDECLKLVVSYEAESGDHYIAPIKIIARYKVIAYMGHL